MRVDIALLRVGPFASGGKLAGLNSDKNDVSYQLIKGADRIDPLPAP